MVQLHLAPSLIGRVVMIELAVHNAMNEPA
jgi:hypothetical protein